MNAQPKRGDPKSWVVVPHTVVHTLVQGKPLLARLVASGAGFIANAKGLLDPETLPQGRAALIYCVKGAGWCDAGGRLHSIRKNELLALPAGISKSCGAHSSNPWTIHWAVASGTDLPSLLRELRLNEESPLMRVGEDAQVMRLFSEVLQALRQGQDYVQMLVASSALTHLLGVLVAKARAPSQEGSDSLRKVAEAIIHMSEHLHEPLRVSSLARAANFSTAHFSELFKQQTGCAPREYLRLLRMHRACQLLGSSDASIKEIAARVGYQDALHFSRQFKAFEGVSPKRYRDSARA